MPASSQMAYRVALDHLEQIVQPDRLAKLTPQVMSRFQAEARKQGMKATTLARHLRCIKACLRWGERQGLLAKAPTIEMPKLPKGAPWPSIGPPTAEEFDRMLAVVPKVRLRDDAGMGAGCCTACGFVDCGLAKPWPSIGARARSSSTPPAGTRPSNRAEGAEKPPGSGNRAMTRTLPSDPCRDTRGGAGRPSIPADGPRHGRPLGAATRSAPWCPRSAEGRRGGGQTDKLIDEDGRRVQKPVKLFAGPTTYDASFAPDGRGRFMPAVLPRRRGTLTYRRRWAITFPDRLTRLGPLVGRSTGNRRSGPR